LAEQTRQLVAHLPHGVVVEAESILYPEAQVPQAVPEVQISQLLAQVTQAPSERYQPSSQVVQAEVVQTAQLAEH